MTFTAHSDYLRLCQTNPRNLWFFTVEDVCDSTFIQGHLVLPSVGSIKYLGLPECLAYSHHKTQFPYRFDYYMLSQSTKNAIRLESDRSVFKTWKKCCRKDAVVQIIIRPEGSLPPNQFHAYSHYETSAERKAILSKLYTSAHPKLPEIELRPEILNTHITNTHLRVDDGTCVSIRRKDLLQTMNYALYKGEALIDLQVPIFNVKDPQQKIKTLTLDAKIWKQLARGLWKEDFACLWKSYNAELKMKVREESPLWQFLIGIGLVGPGSPHECDKCKRDSEKSEKENMSLETRPSDDSNQTPQTETESFPMF